MDDGTHLFCRILVCLACASFLDVSSAATCINRDLLGHSLVAGECTAAVAGEPEGEPELPHIASQSTEEKGR